MNSFLYNRRGLKASPIFIQGDKMKDIVVGRINSLNDRPIPYHCKKDNFLEFLEGYKKKLNESLEAAIAENNNNKALMITGKIVTCNDIELAYIKLSKV
jgi:hypothetical protein